MLLHVIVAVRALEFSAHPFPSQTRESSVTHARVIACKHPTHKMTRLHSFCTQLCMPSKSIAYHHSCVSRVAMLLHIDVAVHALVVQEHCTRLGQCLFSLTHTQAMSDIHELQVRGASPRHKRAVEERADACMHISFASCRALETRILRKTNQSCTCTCIKTNCETHLLLPAAVVAFRVLVVQIEIAASLGPCRCNLVSAARGSGDGCPQHRQSNTAKTRANTQAAGEASQEAAACLSMLELRMSLSRMAKARTPKVAACLRCGDRTQGAGKGYGRPEARHFLAKIACEERQDAVKMHQTCTG
jgi:hypothetical protein